MYLSVDGNLMSVKAVHVKKHDDPMESTPSGISIEEILADENA
jgi:hypothetical protein